MCVKRLVRICECKYCIIVSRSVIVQVTKRREKSLVSFISSTKKIVPPISV